MFKRWLKFVHIIHVNHITHAVHFIVITEKATIVQGSSIRLSKTITLKYIYDKLSIKFI